MASTPTDKQTDKPCILVVGGSGYLGQFLVQHFASQPAYRVGFTHHSTSAPEFGKDVKAFWVDLATGQGVQDVFEAMGVVDVVLNCAALSSPGQCEQHPEAARSINIPTVLVEALELHACTHDRHPLLVHISTDQVYSGSQADWRESDPCEPVNTYGRTKLQAEQLLQERWADHVILRSSIIYGPDAPQPVNRSLFLQFILRALAAGKPTTFFADEFRSPIFVGDICSVVAALIEARADLSRDDSPRLFNMGGPERLSRVDMAEQLAAHLGVDASKVIVAAPAASSSRPMTSPLDISMDSSRLKAALPQLQLTTFAKALERLDLKQQFSEAAS